LGANEHSCGLENEVYDDSDEDSDDENDNLSFSFNAGQNLTCYVGNQGRGTVTVYKDVTTMEMARLMSLRNRLVGNWELSIIPQVPLKTAADTYSLTEFEDHTGYHFVSWFEDQNIGSISTNITVNPGDDIECTFTNARDTGTIIVNKIIDIDGIPERVKRKINLLVKIGRWMLMDKGGHV
jgi:hypothetical protein